MNFSEVQQSVQQAWDFTWPPIVLLAIMIALARFLAPVSYAALRSWLISQAPSRWSRARAALHHLGISKLLPVASLFLIVFTLFLTNNIVHLVGNSIPPRINFQPGTIFAWTVDEKQLACLWSFFPWSDFETLQIIIKKRIESEEKLDSGVKEWRESSNRAYRRFDAVKFLAVWALFWGIAERWHGRFQIARVAAILAILACMAMVYLFEFLYSLDQWQYAQKSAAIALWINKKSCIDTAGQPLILTPEQRAQWDQEKAGGRGWSIHAPFEEYWHWIHRRLP